MTYQTRAPVPEGCYLEAIYCAAEMPEASGQKGAGAFLDDAAARSGAVAAGHWTSGERYWRQPFASELAGGGVKYNNYRPGGRWAQHEQHFDHHYGLYKGRRCVAVFWFPYAPAAHLSEAWHLPSIALWSLPESAYGNTSSAFLLCHMGTKVYWGAEALDEKHRIM